MPGPLPAGRPACEHYGQPSCCGLPYATAQDRGPGFMETQAAAVRPRRSDAGRVRLQQRDLDGLLLVAEHYAAPYDLLAEALGVTPARVRSVAARWRAAG